MIRKTSPYLAIWPLMTLAIAACSQPGPDDRVPEPEGTQTQAVTTAVPAAAAESKTGGCEGGERRHRDPASLVQKLDTNKNGTLEVSELPEHKRAWLGAADANKDGQLSLDELAKHKGGKFGHKDPAAMVARFDADANGTLELAELPEHKREKLSAADANKDNRLSTDELKAHFESRRAKHRGDLDTKQKPTTDVM